MFTQNEAEKNIKSDSYCEKIVFALRRYFAFSKNDCSFGRDIPH